MKKTMIVLAIAMAAMFCVLLGGCGSRGGGDLSDSKYVGTWKAVSMSVGDTEEAITDGEYILTLNGDGTGSFDSVGPEGDKESSKITWELTDNGFKTKGDAKLKFKDDGKKIHAKIIGVDLNFEKQ